MLGIVSLDESKEMHDDRPHLREFVRYGYDS